jgi:hypothetical protein
MTHDTQIRRDKIRMQLGPLRQKRRMINAKIGGLESEIAELAAEEKRLLDRIESLEMELLKLDDQEV